MAGFREFVTGEVLTAANVDDFLMKQSVQKYADAAARDAALGTAVAGGNALREGMASYLDDTNEFEVYNGSAWNGLGGLVAVTQAVKTSSQVTAVAASGVVVISGLEITHSVASAGNKVLLLASVVGTVTNIAFRGNATVLSGFIGDAASDRTRVSAAEDGSASKPGTLMVAALYEPPSTAAVDYDVALIGISGGTVTAYVNLSSDDANNTNFRVRAVSSLTLLEVKV